MGFDVYEYSENKYAAMQRINLLSDNICCINSAVIGIYRYNACRLSSQQSRMDQVVKSVRSAVRIHFQQTFLLQFYVAILFYSALNLIFYHLCLPLTTLGGLLIEFEVILTGFYRILGPECVSIA